MGAIRLSEDSSKRDGRASVEQMSLPSAAGAQRGLCHWLPRIVCCDSVLSASSFSPPQLTLPTATKMSSPTAQFRLPLPPFPGLSPPALAWQDPTPDITSTYFLSHVVPWSSGNLSTPGHSPSSHISVFPHLGVSACPAPSVSHPCKSQLYIPSKVRDGKCEPRACSDHLAVLPC